MTPVTQKVANSLVDFTTIIESYTTHNSHNWYRGVGKESYALQPSLYRHPGKYDIAKYMEMEASLLERFKQRSVPFIERKLSYEDHWEYIFLMQHYGTPTRLLDWSENPFIALFFALTSATPDPITQLHSDSCCVWLLDTINWNKKALSHISYKGSACSVSENWAESNKPLTPPARMSNDPIAIYGTHNSVRIVAQRGVFTIFGQDITDMKTIAETKDYPNASLVQIVIPASVIASLKEKLLQIGYTQSVVYPDLDGLAKELKTQYGF